MSYPIDNSIFLLKRWGLRLLSALVLTLSGGALAGQSTSIAVSYAAETSHFRIVAPPRAARAAENALRRLEFLRSALIQLHGESWTPKGKVHVWLPENTRAFRQVVQEDYERGLFQSGPRIDWMAVDPGASHFDEVLAHEYLHSVLSWRYPNLPRWIEEGVCDYYASLRLVRQGQLSFLEIGAPPGNRRELLRSSREWDTTALMGKRFPPEAYAWAWAHIHVAARESTLPDILTTARTRRWTKPLAAVEYPLTRVPAPPQEDISIRSLSGNEAAEMLATVRTALQPQSGPALGESSFLQGLRLLDDGNPEAAIPLLQEALRLAPSQSSWWLALATAYQESGAAEQRLHATRQALNTAVTEAEKRAAEAAMRALK